MNFENKSIRENNNEIEKNEQIETIIEGYIKARIMLAPEIGEGNNGVGSLVNFSDLPPEVLKYLGLEINNNNGSFAMKTLKIYEEGKGQQEATLHLRADEILTAEKKNGAKQLPGVPRLYFNRQFQIGENETDLMARLEAEGINIESKKFDILVMDYIEGDDFGTYILKQAMMRLNDSELSNDEELLSLRDELIKTKSRCHINFNELYQIVGNLLNLKVNDYKEYNSKMKTEKENHHILADFLKKRGFSLDLEKFFELENGIRALNKNDFYHRDLHERNVMVKTDNEGIIVNYYIIDFGTSIDIRDRHIDNPYEEDTILYETDLFIPNLYRDLASDPAGVKFSREELRMVKEAESMLSRMKSKLGINELWESLEKSSGSELDSVFNAIGKASFLDTSNLWEGKCALLFEVGKNRPDIALEYIDDNINKVTVSIRNRLLDLKKILKK